MYLFSELKCQISSSNNSFAFQISLLYMKITIDTSNNCYAERLFEVGGLTYIIYNMKRKNKRYGINFLVAT